MLQVSVSRGVVHDALWWTLAVVVILHILNQPPAPPDRTAHQRPAPQRVPRGEDKAPEGRENITPLPTAGFATGAATA